MKQNNKLKELYYTPVLSEFYLGFECEIIEESGKMINRDNKKEWKHETCDMDTVLLAHSCLEHENSDYLFSDLYRVKYLDYEDIESLGFKHIGSGWFENELQNFRIRKWKDLEVTIWFNYSYNFNREDESEIRFRGDIKNKSELKNVLSMIKFYEK